MYMYVYIYTYVYLYINISFVPGDECKIDAKLGARPPGVRSRLEHRFRHLPPHLRTGYFPYIYSPVLTVYIHL